MVVVDDELGRELVRLALKEAVETVEPACEGPLVEGARCRVLLRGCEVPLSCTERDIARFLQHFSHRRGVIGDMAELVRETRSEVRHVAHADGVLRTAGEQRRARRARPLAR